MNKSNDTHKIINDIAAYKHLVTTATWEEVRPNEHGKEQSYSVNGELWTKALQAALDAFGEIYIPARAEPYYLDAPLILKSEDKLLAAPNAEIRLKPGTNTCMIRNLNLINGQNKPISLGNSPDLDIVIEGGIWTTLATSKTQFNGNTKGCADYTDSFPGAHGTILLHNVYNVTVRNLTIKECKPFGIQIGCCQSFRVENITFENTQRDGVHVGGPTSDGVISGICGVTGDDIVALNAWDWQGSTMSFGVIKNIHVENVEATGRKLRKWASNIRLLGGTKHFKNGQLENCDIEHCTFINISGVKTFDMFDQPNLELGRENDFADPIGTFRDISFKNIHFQHNSPLPPFQIGSNIDGLFISDVYLHFNPLPEFKLIQIGPQSETYKHKQNDPNTWVEIYSPDKDCTVKNLRMIDVYALLPEHRKLSGVDLISIVIQKLNPDYPNTTPKGGTGRGILVHENEEII